MNIREIKEEDLDILSKKYMDSYNRDKGSWTYINSYARLNQFFTMKGFYGLVMFYEYEPVGLVFGYTYNLEDKIYYYLEEIVVFDDLKGKGYGTELMKSLEEKLKDKGVLYVDLKTTRENYHQNFYTRLGYKEAEKLVLMTKKIAN